MTEFSFEHVFRAPSVAAVFAAYVDPAHLVEQDRTTQIATREFLELHDDATSYRRECRVVPARQLPAIIRPLLKGTLEFRESVRWDKTGTVIQIEIRPQILDGKARVSSTYALFPAGNDAVRRVYSGTATVDVRLIGRRIERGIVEDIESSLVLARACTQAFLDRTGGSGHPVPGAGA